MVDPVDKYSNSSQLVPVNHIGIINSDTLISYSTQLIGVPTIFVQCHLASGVSVEDELEGRCARVNARNHEIIYLAMPIVQIK